MASVKSAVPSDFVYVVGYAQSSKRCCVGSLYDVFAVEMVINPDNDLIVDASCVLITEVGKKFVSNLLVGRSIVSDYEAIVKDVVRKFLSLNQKALVTAIKDARTKYDNSKTK
jgi:hypothetical protein